MITFSQWTGLGWRRTCFFSFALVLGVMAVFVDLSDSDTPDPGKPSWPDAAYFARHSASTRVANDDAEANPDGDASNSHEETVERENPNRNPTTEALGCYPYAATLSLDILAGGRRNK